MTAKAQVYPRNPERVAWTVLLTAFFTLVALTSTLLVGGSYWLRNAAVVQTVAPVYSGTVLVTRPGTTLPQANPPDIPVQSTIATNANVQATLTFATGDGRSVVATAWSICADRQPARISFWCRSNSSRYARRNASGSPTTSRPVSRSSIRVKSSKGKVTSAGSNVCKTITSCRLCRKCLSAAMSDVFSHVCQAEKLRLFCTAFFRLDKLTPRFDELALGFRLTSL